MALVSSPENSNSLMVYPDAQSNFLYRPANNEKIIARNQKNHTAEALSRPAPSYHAQLIVAGWVRDHSALFRFMPSVIVDMMVRYYRAPCVDFTTFTQRQVRQPDPLFRDIQDFRFSLCKKHLAVLTRSSLCVLNRQDLDAPPIFLEKDFPRNEEISSLACDPSRNYLVSGGDHKNIELWDFNALQEYSVFLSATRRKKAVSLKGSKGFVYPKFSQSGSYLAACARNNLKVWDMRNRTEVPVSLKLEDAMRAKNLYFTPDEQYLVTTASTHRDGFGYYANIYIWEKTKESNQSLTPSLTTTKPIDAATMSSDGKHLAWGLKSGAIQVGTIPNLNSSPIIPLNHGGTVHSLAFSPSAKCLASGGWQDIKIWDIQQDKPTLLAHFKDMRGLIVKLKFNSIGNCLFAQTSYGYLLASKYNGKSWSEFITFESEVLRPIVFSQDNSVQDNSVLITVNRDGGIKVLQAKRD